MKYKWKGNYKFTYKGNQYQPGDTVDIDEKLLSTPLKPLFEKIEVKPAFKSISLGKSKKTKKEVDANEGMESS